MVLIHQPYGDSYGTWRALEEYQAALDSHFKCNTMVPVV